MKILNLAYNTYPNQGDPYKWIDGFRFFNGIWEAISAKEEVVMLQFINHSGTIERRGVQHIFLKKTKREMQWPWKLNRQIAALKPDVVMVHSLLFPVQVLLLRIQLGSKVKIVVQHHAELPFKNRIKKLIQRITDRVVDAYFFTSNGLADEWINERLIKNERKLHEIMEVSSVFQQEDKAKARITTGMSEGNAYLWIGHLINRKNPLLVVKAFLKFVEQGAEDATLYMIFQSTALLNEIEQILGQHPEAAKQIKLVGHVPNQQLQSWCSSADFIISSSFYEGSGIAVCEGMSCGCIPILTDIPSFRFMTGSKCGFLYETDNENALLEVLKKSSKMDRMQGERETLRQYQDHLSFEAIAAKIQDLLSSL